MRFVLVLISLSTASVSEACPSFGLSSQYLNEYFCNQLDDLKVPKTRAVTSNGDRPKTHGETDLTQPHSDWMQLPLVQEAWRSDPAKTLKLIERIREAGGRPQK